MNHYEDSVILLDQEGITIKNYSRPRHQRRISYSAIRSASLIELGLLTGRHRLVGLGFRRPRHFFHWDSHRSSKTHAISLDVGKVIHPVISPDDHQTVLDIIEEHRLAGDNAA